MNVEIIEFFPNDRCDKKGILNGTFKVLLPDLGIHLLGVFIAKSKGCWFIRMPWLKGIHHVTGEKVQYPMWAFSEKEKNVELIKILKEKGGEFIENRLKDVENPLIFPIKPPYVPTKRPPHPPRIKTIEKPKPVASVEAVQAKVWADPPKRVLPYCAKNKLLKKS